MYDNANTAEIFSNNLKELMQRNQKTGQKITQRALAEFLGVSAQSVYLYCSGQVFPEYKQLLAIAEYFGVSVDYLLTGKQPENKSLRESLHLSDAAINNLTSCDKEFAPFVDKLLSDKDFFTTYQAAIKPIQDTRQDLLNGWRFGDLHMYCKGIILGGFAHMGVYFEKFLSKLVESEILTQATQENELTENDEKIFNNLPDNRKMPKSQFRVYGTL